MLGIFNEAPPLWLVEQFPALCELRIVGHLTVCGQDAVQPETEGYLCAHFLHCLSA